MLDREDPLSKKKKKEVRHSGTCLSVIQTTWKVDIRRIGRIGV
jgi:hypothetical protein